MRNDDTESKKVESSYQSILKIVEDLVEKEGKNLKEAFLIAEEKIAELGELGREEANKISDEVFQDLNSLGETVEEAKDSFKQKWQLGSKYLTDATWKILSDVADNTTVALADFRKELQQRRDELTKDLHQREHKDHQQWHSDHQMWQTEINTWSREYEQAIQDLDKVKEEVQQRIEQLQSHARMINTHDYIDQVHEKDIARSEQDPDNPVINVITEHNAEAYEEMAQRHKEDAEAHEKIKKEFRRIMPLINKLKKYR